MNSSPSFFPTLVERYRAIMASLGGVLLIAAVALLLPLIAILWYPEESITAPAFFLPALVAVVLGAILLTTFSRRSTVKLQVEDSAVVVVVSWFATIAVSMLPFVLATNASALGALFEAVSGWTTTGLSVLDVEAVPHTILLWRSIMQWFGGLGFAVLMSAAVLGPWAYGLYQAEGRSELLLPHIKRTTKLILSIYLVLTAAGTAAFMLTGMGGFDALNHAMCALSTGGFSTRTASLGAYGSASAEAITMILMAIGTTNYGVVFLVMRKRYRSAWKHGEVRVFAAGLVMVVGLLRFASTLPFRDVVFQAVSSLSTSGFSTVNFDQLSDAAMMMLVMAMIVGGQVNATAGGLKQYRVYLAYKSVAIYIRRLLKPRAVISPLMINHLGERRSISSGEASQNSAYVMMYLATYALGVLAITALGYSLREAAFEFASSLGTVGLSIGITGAHSPPALLYIEMVGMILGRLEFTVIFIGVAKMGQAIPRLLRPNGRA